MPSFHLLSNPASYRPCSTENMLTDHDYRNYWLRHFESHFDLVLQLALDTYGQHRAPDTIACRKSLLKTLHAINARPNLYGELDLIVLDMIRQQKLRAFDLPDPFLKMKARENQASLKIYPAVIQELDSHAADNPQKELLLLIEGIFAGNIFDLGAGATAKRFATESPDFLAIRNNIAHSRPWLVDHFNQFAHDLLTQNTRHKKALIFLDNAGSDCILGILPFARFLAQRNTTVLLAANALPALNDMTYQELRPVLAQVADLDPPFKKYLQSGLIKPLNSGGVAPLIDLRHISDDLNHQSQDADLIFLEGMGRGLESNYEAQFKVPSIKLCMIKEQIVADRHHGKLYDTIFRYDPPTP